MDRREGGREGGKEGGKEGGRYDEPEYRMCVHGLSEVTAGTVYSSNKTTYRHYVRLLRLSYVVIRLLQSEISRLAFVARHFRSRQSSLAFANCNVIWIRPLRSPPMFRVYGRATNVGRESAITLFSLL